MHTNSSPWGRVGSRVISGIRFLSAGGFLLTCQPAVTASDPRDHASLAGSGKRWGLEKEGKGRAKKCSPVEPPLISVPKISRKSKFSREANSLPVTSDVPFHRPRPFHMRNLKGREL